MQVELAILAAGKSVRFGSDKRLYTLNPVIRSVDNAIGSRLYKIQCMLRESDSEGFSKNLYKPKNTQLEVLYLEDLEAEKGMSQSIISAIENTDDATDVKMIALGDMPYIQSVTFKKVIDQASSNRIVVPKYSNQCGHPVAFGKKFFTQLKLLSGDIGGKKIISNNKHDVLFINTDDEYCIKDVDAKEDLLDL